jgi:hypothetical protein
MACGGTALVLICISLDFAIILDQEFTDTCVAKGKAEAMSVYKSHFPLTSGSPPMRLEARNVTAAGC